MKRKKENEADELRPEYDLNKLKFIGRGIYAQRYRSGTNLVLLEPDVGTAGAKRPAQKRRQTSRSQHVR